MAGDDDIREDDEDLDAEDDDDDLEGEDLDDLDDDEDLGDEDLGDEDDEPLDGDEDDVGAPLEPSVASVGGGIERVEQIVLPVIEDFGLELYDVEIGTRRGRTVLEVTVDRPSGRAPGQGITLRELVEVNREISAALDVDDPLQGRYSLEVNSPGVERPLTRPRHFERSLGELVHVVFNRVIDGQTAVDGRLASFAGESVTVSLGAERTVTVPLDAIKSARTVYDWAAASGQKKGGGGKKAKKGKKG